MKTAGNQLKFETARPSGRGSTLPIKLGRNLYHLRPGVTMSSFSVFREQNLNFLEFSVTCIDRLQDSFFNGDRDCEKKYRGRETSENEKKWGELINHTVQ